MKILYYFGDNGSNMTAWQRLHIFSELSQNGHELTLFNPYDYKYIDEANEQLVKFVNANKGKFDVFINPAPSSYLFRETVIKIRESGLPAVLICFDNLHAPFIHKEIASAFDLVWLTSFETEPLFKSWGCNTIFLPYAANPEMFYYEPGAVIPEIGFIGTLYGDRVNRINQLTQNQVPCTIYSSQLNNEGVQQNNKIEKATDMFRLLYNLSQFEIGRKVALGRIKNRLFGTPVLNRNQYLKISQSVSFDEIHKIYSNHTLSLNITELAFTYNFKKPVHKIHLRTFEIGMSGGAQIAPYIDELAGYYEEDKEIILCKSDEEFISKAKYYLDPSKAEHVLKIKQNARSRSLAEHTWTHRFDKLFVRLFS